MGGGVCFHAFTPKIQTKLMPNRLESTLKHYLINVTSSMQRCKNEMLVSELIGEALNLCTSCNESADKRKCCYLRVRFCWLIQRDKYFTNSETGIFPYSVVTWLLWWTAAASGTHFNYANTQQKPNSTMWTETCGVRGSNQTLVWTNPTKTKNIIQIKLTLATVCAVLSIDLLVLPLNTWFSGYSHREKKYK